MSATALPTEARDAEHDDPLLECLSILMRLHGRPVSTAALAAGMPLENERLTPAILVRAAETHGCSARIVRRALRRVSNLVLPAILLLRDGRACVLCSLRGGKAEVILPESGMGTKTVELRELARDYTGYAAFVHPKPRPDARLSADLPVSTRSWFWGTLWRFKRYYAETALAAILVNLLTVAVSLFVMNVYDRVVPNQALETLWVLALGTSLAIGFEFLARTLRGYFIDVVGKKIDLLLASRLFQQAIALRMASRPPSAGALASNLRDFEAVRDFFTAATLTVLFDLPFVAFFIWIVALIGGPLFWVPALAVPVLLLAGLLVQFPLARAMRRYVAESALKHGVLVESIEGAETLKTLRGEGVMQKRWEELTAQTARMSLTTRFLSGLVVNLAMLLQQVVTVLVVVMGVYRIGEGLLTVGGLVACTILSGRALAPLGQLAGVLARLQHTRAALRSLNRVMDLPVDRPPERTFVHREHLDGGVEFDDVVFAYPGQNTPVLDRIDFRLAPGERVGILGRVGAGKSTCLRLALGLYAPSSGAVRLDGIDVQQMEPADVRRNLGFVSQDVRLFYGTLRDNLVMGAPLASDEDILAAARLAGLDRLIATHPLGLDLMIGERGEGLSGGQRQAVGIARTLLLAPAVLLLDEPTASMDHTTEQAFIGQMRTWMRGRTVLLATHKPAMLELVERLIVLDGGKLVADGPRDDVLKALMRPAQPAGAA